MAPSAKKTSYVNKIDADQAARLRVKLEQAQWEIDQAPHALWRARNGKTTVVAYQSGKLVAQGKGTPEFVQFILEPEILGEARFGYEAEWAQIENPKMFEPHAGIDESGKGDYFGPLVIASAYVDPVTSKQLLDIGVADSKAIKSDKKINHLNDEIKRLVRGRFSLVAIGPEAYNRMVDKMGNVNKILAWGHARAIENLLEKVPDCPRAVSDQFAHPRVIKQALLENGRNIELEQYPRAETDVAVAAASILARADFIRRMEQLGETVGLEKLPRGAGANVDRIAREIVKEHGRDVLNRIAKVHFKTTQKVLM